MKAIIEQAIQSAISFETYKTLFEKLVEEGRTTGSNQSEGYVSYTKLNWSRYKRAEKHVQLSESTIFQLQSIETPITLLIITEAWCGDASQALPVIEKMETISSNLTAKLVLRDEHEALMNLFLTNGAKAIPKIIALDNKFNVIGTWGPRPSELQQKVVEFKIQKPTATGIDISSMTQKWYNENRGAAIQYELLEMISQLEVKLDIIN